ncbi:cyclic nucleotide-binding domain-containing protein 2 [Exaiptasia diaphana]|uniref:Cyclic nucleotide-binding domain-containing protein n=1 Tax=Exaiptasia diaphana TaxID=2652724 RepID=A0A913YNY2_EXADI|nr:cyclic nucleotide-binding domain-containing protein 2 [Exaiptasia diaphana]
MSTMLANGYSQQTTKKSSLHGAIHLTVDDSPTIFPKTFRRDSRRISLNAVQAFSSTRRSTIHHTGHGAVDLLGAASSPYNIMYTSRAVKAYRQRRALHHKNLKGKKKKVIILRNAFKNIVLYASQKGRHEQITSETTLSLRANTAKGTYDDLLFDPEAFKSQFKDSFPLWAKQVAEKPPNKRTDEEVKLLVRLMKQLKGFRRYSPDVQTSFCRVLKYDRYGRRRVIIRKGHIAQRLYFIFSGSVCVTDDEDEDSAFANTEDEKACLKRGDYFGELAFLKNIRRAATIVCLEQTEFLSVSREDFFETGIDKCFARDLEKRIQFLSNHPLFVTWPRRSILHIAEVSRVHAYHSDDVIVKNSTDSYWMYFITKGQSEVLRLVDLQSCPAYQKYFSKPNTSVETSMSYPCKTSTTFDSLMLNTFPIIEEDEEDEEGYLKGSVKSCHSDINIPARRRNIPKASTRSKSASVRSSSSSASQLTQSDAQSSKLDIGVGVYMVLDKLTTGSLFGAWSVIKQEDEKDRKRPKVKERRFILLSEGCEVIKMPKKEFTKDADSETIEHLRLLTANYPTDNKLCQAYLKQSNWRCYREELVDDIIERKQAIKHGVTRTLAKPTPIVSPLCSFVAQHPASSNWEYFRGTGWTASKVISPVIKAGKKQKPRRTPTPHQSCNRSTPVSRFSQRAGSCSRYPLNPNPLVGEKLVVAKGSHRSLVLTHGGIRCNDYIEEIVPGVTV